jgi:predicted RND superfamily exporter protein
MLPLVVVVAAVLLGALLRTRRGAVLPLLVVLTAVVWTLGLMAWMGATFYVITILMPTLLIAIGVADGIHVIHQFMLGVGARPDQPTREIVLSTMEEMTRPVVMTSITTAAGFSSLALSPIMAVRSLGLFTAAGVLAAMVFSLTILPALLCVLPAPLAAARHAKRTQAGRGLLTRPLAALTPFVVRRPVLAASVGGAVLLAGLSGLPRIVVDGSLIRNFPATNPIRLADAELIRYFGGSYPMQIVFEAANDDAWNDPVKLHAVAGLQQRIEAAEYTGKTRSLADYVKRMHQALHPENPGAHVLPDRQDLVAQYLFLYSLSGAPDDFEDVVDYGYRQACAHALVRADHSPLLKRVIADIDAYAARYLAPLDISTRVTGNAKIAYVFIDLITTGQVRSLLVALVLVLLLTGLLCRALAAGAFAVIPVAVAIALNFGVLGWFGIPLGPTTAMISSIGIGIGVDYAIHFLIKYQRVRRAGLAPEFAMRETLGTTGVAIFYNAVVVFAGFMVLIGSQFPPNRVLGILVAMNMVVCFLGTVTLMAALLHRLQPDFVRRPQG